MIYLLLSLFMLGILAFVVGFFRNRSLQKKIDKGEIDERPSVVQIQNMECCGQHEVCERDSLLAAVSKEIEYYDDEELDRFAGWDDSQYDEQQEDEFRNILYTMKEEEVPGWVRSLQLRGINLPQGLRDEVVMIVNDVRTGA